MYSVGVDIAKEKSVVAILTEYGEIVAAPKTYEHTRKALLEMNDSIRNLDGEVRIVLEATGAYHLPVVTFLQEQGFFVAVINPFIIKKYTAMDIRKVKTDSADALKIAAYGVDNWRHLINYLPTEEVYAEMRILNHQYLHYIDVLTKAKLNLTNLLDRTLPGAKAFFPSLSRASGKDMLCDFVESFWHRDVISSMSEKRFIAEYCKWAKKKEYRSSETKAKSLYTNALEGIPTLPSNSPSTKMLVLEAVKAVRETETTLTVILTRMAGLAKKLPEYDTVRALPGVGDVMAPRLIAEVGDVRRFHSAKALVAYAGIDAPPYQSGNFNGTNRHISKRGSPTLRKTGYEIMKYIKTGKPKADTAVYQFMLKKEAEGKPKKVAKIAGLNKFLHIYYARVSALNSI